MEVAEPDAVLYTSFLFPEKITLGGVFFMPVDKKESPLISVIIPVYNAEKFLPECLQSVQSQTLHDFEVIMIDDGSTDRSGEIYRKIAASDNRFIMISQQENRGPSAGRNAALDVARGETVLFLDADDILPKNALALLYDALKANNSDICFGKFIYFDMKGEIPIPFVFPDRAFSLDKDDIFQTLVKQMKSPNKEFMFAYVWGHLFKRDIISELNLRFDENMRTYEDLKFIYQLASVVDNLTFIPTTVYNYRIHSNGNNISMGIFPNHNRLMDLFPFYKTMKLVLSQGGATDMAIADNCMVNLAIIHIVRLCHSMTLGNMPLVYKHVDELMKKEEFTAAIKNYDASKPGRSKLMPILMRFRITVFILLLGKIKALRRYGRRKNK